MAQLLVGGDDDILHLEVCGVVCFAVNNNLYNVSVQNNYQPSSSIQITTEAQQKLDEIKAAKEAEASSEEPVVEPEPEPESEPESEPAVEEEWTPPPVILEPEPTPEPESTPEPEVSEEELPLVTDSE